MYELGGGVTVLSTELNKRQHTGRGTAPGITHYSESESLSLLPPSTRAGTPLGHTSPCL